MRQYVDSTTGEIYYTGEALRQADENVKVFRPVSHSSKFVKNKASQKANEATAQKAVTRLRLAFC
ncbi:hypothetical protein [Brevibacillus formosus]|uniref:hypothetical protein n=1 Tax=Brevibacillus formosus TaxID=54913 RepID=UPI003F1C7467